MTPFLLFLYMVALAAGVLMIGAAVGVCFWVRHIFRGWLK